MNNDFLSIWVKQYHKQIFHLLKKKAFYSTRLQGNHFRYLLILPDFTAVTSMFPIEM
jgi:hypothetical protein